MSVSVQRGFTLIELITTIFILAILGAVAIPAFSGIRLNSEISGVSGDMAATLSRARGLAISTRSPVFVIQGAGSSASDVAVGTSWASGWRVLKGATLAGSSAVTRIERQGNFSDINVLVTAGSVNASGTTTGAAINGFGFNNFGQLIKTDLTALTEAAIVICAPNTNNERGRTIAISRIGRVSNNSVDNPASCGS